MDNLESCWRNIGKWIENLIKTTQIEGLRTNMDKITKFSSLILTNKSLIKKKVKYGSKIAKTEETKGSIEL